MDLFSFLISYSNTKSLVLSSSRITKKPYTKCKNPLINLNRDAVLVNCIWLNSHRAIHVIYKVHFTANKQQP